MSFWSSPLAVKLVEHGVKVGYDYVTGGNQESGQKTVQLTSPPPNPPGPPSTASKSISRSNGRDMAWLVEASKRANERMERERAERDTNRREEERARKEQREREKEWERQREEQRQRERQWELDRERERWEEECRERERVAEEERQRIRMAKWTIQFRREELIRTIRKDRIKTKINRFRKQQEIFERRRQHILRMRKKFGSKLHFLKRKEVRELGAKLFWRGLRSLATHGMISVCTHGAGIKAAIVVDHDNYVHVGKLTVNLKDMYDSWNTLRSAIDGLEALDFMQSGWKELAEFRSNFDRVDLPGVDLDDMEKTVDMFSACLNDQNQVLLDNVRKHPALLDGLPGSDVFEPHFGETGESRGVSNLIGPHGEETTQDEHGNLLNKNDHNAPYIDPYECTVKDPEPVPPPPEKVPDPPPDTSKGS